MERTVVSHLFSISDMLYLFILFLLFVIFILIKIVIKQGKLVKQMEEKISTYQITNKNFSFSDTQITNEKEKISEETKKVIQPDYLNLPKRKDRHK